VASIQRGASLFERVHWLSGQAAALLFGCEAFREQIDPGRHQPRTRLVVVENGVGFSACGFGPVNGAAIEMTGIEQRHGAGFGFLAKRVLESEVHDAPGRDSYTQRG